MKSIAKYFKSSKKTDLCDCSKTSKELKILLKSTSALSMSNECDVSSNIHEVIRLVLNLLFIYFFFTMA